MRKLFLTLVLISLSVLSFAGTGNGYTIKGKINGIKDTSVFLGNYYGDKQYIKDTTKVDHNGNFTFTGKEKLPGGIYLIVTPKKNYFEILIDKEQNFSIETDTANFVKNMKVKGSDDNKLFYEYLNFAIAGQVKSDSLMKLLKGAKTKSDTTKVYDQVRDANKQLNNYRLDFIKDHPNHLLAKIFKVLPDPEVPAKPKGADSTWAYYYYRTHYLDNVDFTDDRLLRTPVFHGKLEKYLTTMVPQIPDSLYGQVDTIVHRSMPNKEMMKYVTWWITYHYETSKIMGLDAVFVHMVENYYDKGLCPWTDTSTLRKMHDRAIKIAPNMIGEKAPDLKMLNMEMTPLALSEVKSKYVVIVFWDPTCGHCKKEIPKLDSLYKAVKTKYDMEVFAVDLDGNQKEWMDFVDDKKLEWLNVWDPYNATNFRKLYDIYSTPVIYLLDKDRKIIAKRIDTEQLGKLLDDLSMREKSKLNDNIK